LRWSSSIAKFDYNTKNSTIIRAKLITENNGKKEALNQASVYLVSEYKKDTIAGTRTNSKGDFEMYIPDKDTKYSLKVKPYSTVDNVSILTRGGREISKFNITPAGFEYRLLQPEIVKLAEFEPDEDITARYEAFSESDENAMTSIQTIYYEVNKSEIRPESKPTIDKVIAIMKGNSKLKLEIISHTDAQGDDAFNLTLSEKRAGEVANYIIANGIKAKRLKAIGKGETQIRNRCKNDVFCFDEEHEYNRRTEFKLIK
jgi:outer membrane protein OmpA-like peptidoglycan-associated protein